MRTSSLHYLLIPVAVVGAALLPRQSSTNTAVVDLTVNKGSPQHLASGFIYGIPDPPASPSQIPSTFFSEIGFNYGRAGGAQLSAPCRGWIWGLSEYRCRFQSTLSNYKTTRQYGGNFILLAHDIWGTDHANSSTVWPGDNGSWNDYDNFVAQLISDIIANNMPTGLVWDVWNEADGGYFWTRSQQQWIDLYLRTFEHIRYGKAITSQYSANDCFQLNTRYGTDSNYWAFLRWCADVDKHVVDQLACADQKQRLNP